ncbi:MAG TPA: hypothetical protein VER12_10400 [Polyangiaceae bacterium]|nr:hypothetical protein [Polyangiaceae bacterium]
MLRKILIAIVGVASLASACAKESEPPPAAPQPYVAPAPTLAQPQPAVTAATPAPVVTAPAAAPAGTMATPNAFALPCTSDASCGLGKCNVQFQKCAFPCAGPVDCAAGATCNTMTGLCLPGAAPQ